VIGWPVGGPSVSQFVISLTQWVGVLQELIFTQLVKKFPTFYETQMFMTMFTTAHTCGSYPEPIKSRPHPHILLLRSILILSYHLRLSLKIHCHIVLYKNKIVIHDISLYSILEGRECHEQPSVHRLHITNLNRNVYQTT
jgi:hypothetical protein